MRKITLIMLLGTVLLLLAAGSGLCNGDVPTPITGNEHNMVAYGQVPSAGLDFEGDTYTLYSFGPGGIATDCRSASPVKGDGTFFATIVGDRKGEEIGFQIISDRTGLRYFLGDTIPFEPNATLADLELH